MLMGEFCDEKKFFKLVLLEREKCWIFIIRGLELIGERNVIDIERFFLLEDQIDFWALQMWIQRMC